MPVSLLVIRLDGLGDVVLTTPLFRELKRAFPGSSCTVVVQDAFRPLLVTNPYIDEIIGLRPLQAAWLPVRVRSLLSVLLLYWSRLRGRRFDVAISPRWDVDDQLATFLCSLADADGPGGLHAKRHRLPSSGTIADSTRHSTPVFRRVRSNTKCCAILKS